MFLNFVMLGVYIGVFRPTESIPGVYFTLGSLVFEILAQNLVSGTRKGSKIRNFQCSEFRHVGCLHKGFQTHWIDSRCLFYFRVIGFRDNGPRTKIGFSDPSEGQKSYVFKVPTYVIIDVYNGVLWSTESIYGVHYILRLITLPEYQLLGPLYSHSYQIILI